MEWGILCINPAMQNKVLSFLQNTSWKRRKKKRKSTWQGYHFQMCFKATKQSQKVKIQIVKDINESPEDLEDNRNKCRELFWHLEVWASLFWEIKDSSGSFSWAEIKQVSLQYIICVQRRLWSLHLLKKSHWNRKKHWKIIGFSEECINFCFCSTPGFS